MTRVLIVDDEPMLREELQEALELEDFDVSTAEGVTEAEALCQAERFDVVVTDLKMPKRGGLELLAVLQERDYPAILFVVSGHGAESNSEIACDLGAKACFHKPLNVDDLVQAISAHL